MALTEIEVARTEIEESEVEVATVAGEINDMRSCS